MNILWVNTTYPPASGGGAVYIKSLINEMSTYEGISKIHVLVEAYPGEAKKKYINEKAVIKRFFPFRAGKSKKNLISYFQYIWQNILLLNILNLVEQDETDVVVFHSWYFIFPSLSWMVIKLLKKRGVKIMIDVRDTQMSEAKVRRLSSIADGMICCGLRVCEYLKLEKKSRCRLFHIPIPIEMVNISKQNSDSILERYGLKGSNYIFSPNGITDGKNFSNLFDAWKILIEKGHEIDLVVAGKKRNWRKYYNESLNNGRLHYLGSLDKYEIHAFYSQAKLSISISQDEGLPRVPLEAVHHGKPLIFPPFTPEFNAAFPKRVIANDIDPLTLAKQIRDAIEHRTDPRLYYDLNEHDIKNIGIKTYESFLTLMERS